VATPTFADTTRETAFFAAYDAVLARWPAPPTTVDIESEYGTTRVYTCGPEDGEPLVLLPGHGATATVWFGTAAAFAAHHRVHAVDPLGDAGRSIAHGTPIRTADDLTAWLDHLLTASDIDRAHLCGHSFGGWTALTYALHAGHRVRSLSLLDPTRCFGGFRPGYLLHALPTLVRPTEDRVRAFVDWETGGRGVDPDWLTLYARGAAHFPGAKVVPNRIPAPARLAGLAVPTLLLLAEDSRAHDVRAVAARATRDLPDVTVDVVPGAGHHSLPTERAAEVTSRVLAFLGGRR
jgi:pimeloyl-ACP methyl ester carboxylesterase